MMVSMCAFGALTAVLMGNSERHRQGTARSGWVRQLRLTALPGPRLRPGQDATAAMVSLPSIVLVFARRRRREGRTAGGLAVGSRSPLTSWAGSLVFAALGVAIGYLATAEPPARSR